MPKAPQLAALSSIVEVSRRVTESDCSRRSVAAWWSTHLRYNSLKLAGGTAGGPAVDMQHGQLKCRSMLRAAGGCCLHWPGRRGIQPAGSEYASSQSSPITSHRA